MTDEESAICARAKQRSRRQRGVSRPPKGRLGRRRLGGSRKDRRRKLDAISFGMEGKKEKAKSGGLTHMGTRKGEREEAKLSAQDRSEEAKKEESDEIVWEGAKAGWGTLCDPWERR